MEYKSHNVKKEEINNLLEGVKFKFESYYKHSFDFVWEKDCKKYRIYRYEEIYRFEVQANTEYSYLDICPDTINILDGEVLNEYCLID